MKVLSQGSRSRQKTSLTNWLGTTADRRKLRTGLQPKVEVVCPNPTPPQSGEKEKGAGEKDKEQDAKGNLKMKVKYEVNQ